MRRERALCDHIDETKLRRDRCVEVTISKRAWSLRAGVVLVG
jgi:hypothetical protein